jgi:hypothetical protein
MNLKSNPGLFINRDISCNVGAPSELQYPKSATEERTPKLRPIKIKKRTPRQVAKEETTSSKDSIHSNVSNINILFLNSS